jgi:hypothetical protein
MSEEYYYLDESNNIVFLLYVLFYKELEPHFGESNNLSLVYDEIIKKIEEDKSKKTVLDKVKRLIEAGELEIVFGDKNNLKTIDVEPIGFFSLLESKGIKLSKDAQGAVEETIRNRKLEEEREKRLSTFKTKKLSKTQFEELAKKEPLWSLSKAILYVSGYQSFSNKEYDKECVCNDDELTKIRSYALDSKKIHELDLVQDYAWSSDYEVRPKDFVSWAKEHFISSPFFEEPTEEQRELQGIHYVTPDMQLMFDAVEKFWKQYDLRKPDKSKAPYKQDVVNWLLEEAKKRGISDFSKTRAQHMDTIIRCPEARKGGNTI